MQVAPNLICEVSWRALGWLPAEALAGVSAGAVGGVCWAGALPINNAHNSTIAPHSFLTLSLDACGVFMIGTILQ